MPALISTLLHIPGEICGGRRKENHQPVCSRLQEKKNNLLSWCIILIKQPQLLIWRSVSKRPSSKYEILARKAQTKGLTVTFRPNAAIKNQPAVLSCLVNLSVCLQNMETHNRTPEKNTDKMQQEALIGILTKVPVSNWTS